MSLTEPQMRALREIAACRVTQDRVARYFLDGERDRMRERSIVAVISRGLACHRAAAVNTNLHFLPIELTDRGHEVFVRDTEQEHEPYDGGLRREDKNSWGGR
jgi:hypothetical protein